MARPRMASFFAYTSLDGENAEAERAYILLHATDSRWLAANQTTVEIAEYLDRGTSIDEAASRLAAEYGLPVEEAMEHVRYVAEELTEKGFLNRGPFAATPTAGRSPALATVYLHLTTRCNLNCPHCYVSCPSTNDLSTPLVFRIIDELKSSGGESVTLSGGEPLVHPEIRRILEYIGPGLKVQLLSNGTLIDKEWASFLAHEMDATVQISIDGSKSKIHDAIRGEGSFEKALKAVGFLQESGMGRKLNFAATIMQQNLHDLLEIIRLAQILDVPKVRFLPLRKVGRAREEWNALGAHVGLDEYEKLFDDLYRLRDSRLPAIEIGRGLSGFLLDMDREETVDDIWCPVGRTLTLATNGDVFPCVLMMQDEFKLGNAFHSTLSELIRSDTMARTCQALSERRKRIAKCAECHWRNLCQAGCMGQALDEKETIWDTDGFCAYRKKAYANAFDGFLKKFIRDGCA